MAGESKRGGGGEAEAGTETAEGVEEAAAAAGEGAEEDEEDAADGVSLSRWVFSHGQHTLYPLLRLSFHVRQMGH